MNTNFPINVGGFRVLARVTNRASIVNYYIADAIRSFSYRTGRLVIGLNVLWNSSDPNAKAALLQLCYGKECLAVQLLHLEGGIPQSLRDFLSDSSVTFVGVGITYGINRLTKDYGLRCKNAMEVDPHNAGSSNGRLIVLACKIWRHCVLKSAHSTSSDWSLTVLTDEQVRYAAANACVLFIFGWLEVVRPHCSGLLFGVYCATLLWLCRK